MRRASWMMGAFVAATLAGCGGGNRQQDTVGGSETGTGTGTMGADTGTMAPGATTMDTAMTGTGADTGMGTGTTGADTATNR